MSTWQDARVLGPITKVDEGLVPKQRRAQQVVDGYECD